MFQVVGPTESRLVLDGAHAYSGSYGKLFSFASKLRLRVHHRGWVEDVGPKIRVETKDDFMSREVCFCSAYAPIVTSLVEKPWNYQSAHVEGITSRRDEAQHGAYLKRV